MPSEKHNAKAFFLTLEDRQQIEKMVKEGCSLRQMEKVIKRSHTSIGRDIKLNGGRANYNAERAHRLWRSRKDSIERNVQVPHKRIEECEHKIKILEMQMQIMFEQVKATMNGK